MQTKRPVSSPAPLPPGRSLSGLGVHALSIGGEQAPSDTAEFDAIELDPTNTQPRKKATIGDGILAGSASPYRESSASPPPRRSKSRLVSPPFGSSSGLDVRQANMYDIQRPQTGNKQLWGEQDAPTPRPAFVDPKNLASIQGQKQRQQFLQPKPRRPSQSLQANTSPRSPVASASTPAILRNPANPSTQPLKAPLKDDTYDIILQPETRPISQEQLVAEVKGIYAGLVMVEAKCIEVDNKQATLAQADLSGQPKLNNEQWQALIALHRTLLHEHHDFFLASQHPSASPALRRLASKYAMPARMWRHGIHSFLELLRHRLPASLDHILAFIYLAYSMMALLYETVPAFEDTWIECLGDLGRYRMAIEDDDIRDREVWTGVARHWYSKASDKAPTTERLYHHLAILARPNALQQLFYYSKSLCVVVPFTSTRESILTFFEPITSADKSRNRYRLPALDTTFAKAHRLLSKRNIEKFDLAIKEIPSPLDNQIGRVIRKFMEQGYYIAIANSIAMAEANEKSESMVFFQRSHRPSNATSKIALPRIGDPNILPFPEDFAMRELLWAKTYSPEACFTSITTHCLNTKDKIRDDVGDAGVATVAYQMSFAGPLKFMSKAASTTRAGLRNLISILMPFLLMGLLPAVQAAQADARPTKTKMFVTKWDDKWTEFVESYSNEAIIMLFESLILYSAYKAIIWLNKYLRQIPQASPDRDLERNAGTDTPTLPKESHTLLWCDGIMACCVFFLGRSDRVAAYLLIPLWLFSFGLSVEYLQQQLRSFPKSAGETFFCITTRAAGTAAGFAYPFAPLRGLYSDWVIFAAFAFLPALTFYSGRWAATFRNSGRAKRIEETYGVDDVLSVEIDKMAIKIPERKQPGADTVTHVQPTGAKLEGTRRNNRRRAKRRYYANTVQAANNSVVNQVSQ